MIMDQAQWFGFFVAGGRLSLSDWLSLEEEDRNAAVKAGEEYRDDVIGNIGQATHNLFHALHLTGDKEEIEDLLTNQFFEAYQDIKSPALKGSA